MTRVAGYAAAKAGISNFTAFMLRKLPRSLVKVFVLNAIAPGFFLTEQNRALLTNPDGSYTERGQDVIRQTPFGRMGRAEELCGTIPIPHQRCFQLCHRYGGCSGRRVQRIRHVNSKLQIIKQ